MALPHSVIRNEFVYAYIHRRESIWKRRSTLIAERDERGREINRRHGYIETDGTVSSSIRSHVDLPYAEEMRQSEAKFKALYDRLSIDEANANRNAGMTVYEYLLLEEIQDKEAFLQASQDTGYYDWIGLKAQAEIDHIKHNSFSDIQRLIDMKKSHFGYAGKRCREFFGIKPWDVGAQAAIIAFAGEFDKRLRAYAGNLRAV